MGKCSIFLHKSCIYGDPAASGHSKGAHLKNEFEQNARDEMESGTGFV